MSSLHVRIQLDNEAFQEDRAAEIARLLKVVAKHLAQGFNDGDLVDYNGNRCGAWRVWE